MPWGQAWLALQNHAADEAFFLCFSIAQWLLSKELQCEMQSIHLEVAPTQVAAAGMVILLWPPVPGLRHLVGPTLAV